MTFQKKLRQEGQHRRLQGASGRCNNRNVYNDTFIKVSHHEHIDKEKGILPDASDYKLETINFKLRPRESFV
jgi:hypothetical protein